MEGFAWLAQIILFLMLGLLIAPHDLVPFVTHGCLSLLWCSSWLRGRSRSSHACCRSGSRGVMPDFSYPGVGLRGAVPIYLSIIPALADPSRECRLFSGVFIVVVASLVIQGWTIGTAARLLGFGRAA